MLKKIIALAVATGFALGTAAFAQSTSTKPEDTLSKPGMSKSQMNKSDNGIKSGTTGAGTSDPRDSNKAGTAKTPGEKSRLEDAKEKGGDSGNAQ